MDDGAAMLQGYMLAPLPSLPPELSTVEEEVRESRDRESRESRDVAHVDLSSLWTGSPRAGSSGSLGSPGSMPPPMVLFGFGGLLPPSHFRVLLFTRWLESRPAREPVRPRPVPRPSSGPNLL